MTRRGDLATRTAEPLAQADEAMESPGVRLGDGLYGVWITPSGAGHSTFGETALTPRSRDPLVESEGLFFYLRDSGSRAFWSIGRQPVPRLPERYTAVARPGHFDIARRDHGIAARLEVCVPEEDTLEIRRITLANLSREPRTIEVTSYAEVVLQAWEAHVSHPAFSRLFVQTEAVPGLATLLARRRPREPDETTPWMAHAVVEQGAVEWETDRVRFIGRGRTLASPLAMVVGTGLSGTSGNVLDPILSLRREVMLEPGESRSITYLLGAASDRAAALALIQRWRDARACAGALLRAAAMTERPSVVVANAIVSGDEANGEAAGDPGDPGDVETEIGRDPIPVPARTPGIDDATLSRSRSNGQSTSRLFASPLRHFNGFGGFSTSGHEYVVRLPYRPDSGLRLPPRPWVNVIANETFGCLISETGAGPTWNANSRQHRLTPWFNDALLDPHGEALYLRDEETGEVWSPLPGPRPAAADYEIRHGFGYTRCRHRSHGLFQRTVVFVARHDPVKFVRIRLTNRSGRERELSLYAFQRLVLGEVANAGAHPLTTEIDPQLGAAFARNPNDEAFASRVAFAAAVCPDSVEAQFACDRARFVGRHHTLEEPATPLSGARLEGECGEGLDACFAERLRFRIPARATLELTFLLGEGDDAPQARALVERYREPGDVARALREVREFWRARLSEVRIETPAPALDLMANGWLAYQTIACRLWGRTAFYQSGGAFGFRDQLQDSAALAWLAPAIPRAQLLLNAAHQFVEGDVLHWWHPPHGHGLRTRFADDLLWLPYLTANYVEVTGDSAVLEERVPFVAARPLAPDEDEAYLLPEPTAGATDLYDHGCRAIDRSLAVGRHGLPLFGSGDWNDGMNRVGREGRGESVWMGFFLYALLGDFDALCERRGDDARRARYREHRERLRDDLNTHAWDGRWYLRGFYDDGTPLGSSAGDECRIDALAQAWSVLSGAAPRERAEQAMDSVEEHLVDEGEGLIRLLTPPFEHTPHDPGYIKGYVAGVRENGGQYTHAALWVVQAFARLGRRERAARLLEMLSPVSHAATPARVAVYQTEPYVIAADVYGAPPHVGRGGWSWYTGSAAWMLRATLESVLGLTIRNGDCLVARPCIPDHWPGYRVTLRLPDHSTRYRLVVSNPSGKPITVVRALADGRELRIEDGAAYVPLVRDGARHCVEIELG